MTRWDCSDAGHRGRFTGRRDSQEIISRTGRNVWGLVASVALGYVAWLETDLEHGDPGNPKLNNSRVTDVYTGPISNPLSRAVKILPLAAGPHPTWTADGLAVRRVDGPGKIALAVYDTTGKQLRVERTATNLTDPSWAQGVGYTWCSEGAIRGDGMAPIAIPGVRLYDPARPDSHPERTYALILLADGRWALAAFTTGGFPYFLIAPDGPAPTAAQPMPKGMVLLGPPIPYDDDTGNQRVLYQRATIGIAPYEAWSVSTTDVADVRREWAETGAHVRFPTIT